MDQHALFWPYLAEMAQGFVGGNEAFHDRRRFYIGHTGWYVDRQAIVCSGDFRIGSAADDRHDTVADGKLRDGLADSDDLPGDLEAEDRTVSKGARAIMTFALKEVSPIDARRHDLHEDVARPELRIRNLCEPEHIRPTKVVEDDHFHWSILTWREHAVRCLRQRAASRVDCDRHRPPAGRRLRPRK